MTTAIRPAREADVPAIVHVGHVTWPATYAFAGPAFVATGLAGWWSEAAVRRALATTTTLVAEDDGRIVGMGNVDLRPSVPMIWKLYVEPASQRTGVGTALLRGLLDAVPRERGAVALEHVDGNARAAAFYRALGFVEMRREPGEGARAPGTVRLTIDLERPTAGAR